MTSRNSGILLNRLRYLERFCFVSVDLATGRFAEGDFPFRQKVVRFRFCCCFFYNVFLEALACQEL